MVSSKVIKVGSRGSNLALYQTNHVIGRLRQIYPDREFEVVTVRTQGDINTESSLEGMGLGVFVNEIERLLLDGEIDMAVHSLKDLPTTLPDGLVLGAMLKREDPRDVLVNRWNSPLTQLPDGARIGTGSPRRRVLMNTLCPQATVLPNNNAGIEGFPLQSSVRQYRARVQPADQRERPSGHCGQ